MYSLFYLSLGDCNMSDGIVLTENDIKNIQEVIKEIKNDCEISVDSIIQGQIFGVLESKCTVIY